jgi:hypothetical protein
MAHDITSVLPWLRFTTLVVSSMLKHDSPDVCWTPAGPRRAFLNHIQLYPDTLSTPFRSF